MSDQQITLKPNDKTQTESCCAGSESAQTASRDNPADIRAEVQNHYGEVAALQLTGNASSDCCGSDLYAGEDLSQLPDAAVNSSRGCGNPHAIASLQPGETVLDLGSGGGLDVLLAARQVGPSGYVYGVDMNDRMLELARRNAAKAGAANVEFRKGDLEDLPLPDGTVDLIISNCVVNLTPDKSKALAEAYRVLSPGGRLAISDIVVDGDLSGLPVSEEQIRAGLSWAGCIAGALTISELNRLLQEAGFEEIEVTIEQRYTPDDFNGEIPTTLAGLRPEVVQDLLQRFTSSGIQARKPRG